MDLKQQLKRLEQELTVSREREASLTAEVAALKSENMSLARTSIELSDLKSRLEDRNYELGHIQEEIKEQNIQLIKKSVELSEVMRTLEDKNYEMSRLQGTLEELVYDRTVELQKANKKLLAEVEERKEIQSKLEKSEVRYRTIFEKTGTAMVTIESDIGISMWNEKFLQLSGYSRDELQAGVDWKEFIANEKDEKRMYEYHKARDTGGNGIPNEYEFGFKCKDGTIKTVMVNVNMVPGTGKRLASLIDISSWRKTEQEKKRLETQLIQAQKMEAIGTLAGGIAHDFNNILAALMGYLEMGVNSVEKDSKMGRWLGEALKACHRARELVVQILTFSRLNEMKQRPVRPSPVLTEALKFLRSTLPATIDIRTEIRKTSSSIMGNPTQIHQVIMNLCTNSAQAMEGTGGTLDVLLCDASIDDDSAVELNMEAGDYVVIKVADSGCGIPESIIGRIFDPFFTTKEQGQGTGMGLAVTHGIVQSFGGSVFVESEEGKGTVFTMYFPAVPEVSDLRKPSILTPKGNGEQILLVDDDPGLVDMIREMVETLNYQVEAFTACDAAADRFTEVPDLFDLVITDMTMPGMTGIEFAEKIHAVRSELPVILCTGNDDGIDRKRIGEKGINAFLNKPVERSLLGATIHRLIKESSRD